MPLLHFYDRATLLGALDLPLDPELHALLAARITHMEEAGVLDMTELVVITSETVAAELMAAIGWWPLIDPDGRHYGEPGFIEPFDDVHRASANFHRAVQTVGNAGFAFELLIHVNADRRLVSLCKEQGG